MCRRGGVASQNRSPGKLAGHSAPRPTPDGVCGSQVQQNAAGEGARTAGASVQGPERNGVDRLNADECSACYVERARIAEKLRRELLSEVLSTPDGHELDDIAKIRSAGYVAGWNDRARSLEKELSR